MKLFNIFTICLVSVAIAANPINENDIKSFSDVSAASETHSSIGYLTNSKISNNEILDIQNPHNDGQRINIIPAKEYNDIKKHDQHGFKSTIVNKTYEHEHSEYLRHKYSSVWYDSKGQKHIIGVFNGEFINENDYERYFNLAILGNTLAYLRVSDLNPLFSILAVTIACLVALVLILLPFCTYLLVVKTSSSHKEVNSSTKSSINFSKLEWVIIIIGIFTYPTITIPCALAVFLAKLAYMKYYKKSGYGAVSVGDVEEDFHTHYVDVETIEKAPLV